MRRALLLLLAAGCSEKATADRIEKSVTTVEERGERPWRVLKLDIPEGFTQDVTTVVDADYAISGAVDQEIIVPRMRMTQRFTVEKVDAKGAMHLAAEITDVRFDARPGSMDVSKANAFVHELDGVTMTTTLTPDGRTHGMKLDATTVKTARDQLQQFEEAIDTMVVTLPDVAVGVGARWLVEQTVRMANLKTFYDLHYEIVELTGDTAKLHLDVEIAAGPQPIITGQGVARLEAMAGEGSFDISLDTHQVMDRMTGELTVGMTMTAAGRSLDVDAKTAFQVMPAE